MSGFYLMHRGWQDDPVFRNEAYSRRDAFVWLIEEAAFRPTRIHVASGEIAIDRGQLSHSLRFMAKAWKWDEAKVRRFLSSLVKAKIIDAAIDAGQTVITVCNYDKYQPQKRTGDAADDAEPTQQRRGGDAKKKQGKQVTIEEESPTDSSIGDTPAGPSTMQLALLRPNPAPPPAHDVVGEALRLFELLRAELKPDARQLRPSEKRRIALGRRLSEIGGMPGWLDVLATIRGSPFLRGETSRTGFVAIDWLVEPKNLTKVMEGNYDGQRRDGRDSPATVRTGSADAFAFARTVGGFE